MKKILLLIATIIITVGVYAQDGNTNKKVSKSDKMNYSDSENKNPPDGFMFQNGKLLVVKNGKTTPLEKDTTLSNGTVIMSNGYYMKNDKSKMMLKEGEHMDMSGNITSIDSSKSYQSSDYGNFADGYLYQNGKVMEVKNGEMTPLDEDIELSDGTVIMSDGYYMKMGESKIKFKEGEHMDMSGNLIQAGSSRSIEQSKKPSQKGNMYHSPDSIKNNDY